MVLVLVCYSFQYTARDGRLVTIRPNESYILVSRTTEHWWRVRSDQHTRPFYVPAQYVTEMPTDSSAEDWPTAAPSSGCSSESSDASALYSTTQPRRKQETPSGPEEGPPPPLADDEDLEFPPPPPPHVCDSEPEPEPHRPDSSPEPNPPLESELHNQTEQVLHPEQVSSPPLTQVCRPGAARRGRCSPGQKNHRSDFSHFLLQLAPFYLSYPSLISSQTGPSVMSQRAQYFSQGFGFWRMFHVTS